MSEVDNLSGVNSTLYTPTTEEVRNLFSWDNDEGEIVAKGGFDRWLAEVKAQERERIRANIIDRVQDLSSCHKNDNCQELGALIASYIEEWVDETE